MKKIGAELILFSIATGLAWSTWVTIGIFSSQKAEAVQEAKYDAIIERLVDIKSTLEGRKK